MKKIIFILMCSIGGVALAQNVTQGIQAQIAAYNSQISADQQAINQEQFQIALQNAEIVSDNTKIANLQADYNTVYSKVPANIIVNSAI